MLVSQAPDGTGDRSEQSADRTGDDANRPAHSTASTEQNGKGGGEQKEGFHGRGLSGLWQDGKRRGGSLIACEGNPAGLQGSTATVRGIWCGGRGGP